MTRCISDGHLRVEVYGLVALRAVPELLPCAEAQGPLPIEFVQIYIGFRLHRYSPLSCLPLLTSASPKPQRRYLHVLPRCKEPLQQQHEQQQQEQQQQEHQQQQQEHQQQEQQEQWKELCRIGFKDALLSSCLSHVLFCLSAGTAWVSPRPPVPWDHISPLYQVGHTTSGRNPDVAAGAAFDDKDLIAAPPQTPAAAAAREEGAWSSEQQAAAAPVLLFDESPANGSLAEVRGVRRVLLGLLLLLLSCWVLFDVTLPAMIAPSPPPKPQADQQQGDLLAHLTAAAATAFSPFLGLLVQSAYMLSQAGEAPSPPQEAEPPPIALDKLLVHLRQRPLLVSFEAAAFFVGGALFFWGLFRLVTSAPSAAKSYLLRRRKKRI
ncbi:hypothetical protein Esti_002942 [Eimeria stiedai]